MKPDASNGGRAEVGQELAGIVGLPWLLSLLGGVLLVQTHQEVSVVLRVNV